MSKKLLGAAAALLALPAAAHAQSDWFAASQPTYQGFYVGAEGGLNWLLNNQSYVMDTGWAVGGKVGYDFVGPRVELEGSWKECTIPTPATPSWPSRPVTPPSAAGWSRCR
jgi:hypothetical protein